MRTAVKVTSLRAERLLPNAGNPWAYGREFLGDSHRRAAVASFTVPTGRAGGRRRWELAGTDSGSGLWREMICSSTQRGKTLLGPRGSQAPESAGRVPTRTDRPGSLLASSPQLPSFSSQCGWALLSGEMSESMTLVYSREALTSAKGPTDASEYISGTDTDTLRQPADQSPQVPSTEPLSSCPRPAVGKPTSCSQSFCNGTMSMPTLSSDRMGGSPAGRREHCVLFPLDGWAGYSTATSGGAQGQRLLPGTPAPRGFPLQPAHAGGRRGSQPPSSLAGILSLLQR